MKFSVCQNEEIKRTYQENSDSEKQVRCPKAPERGSTTRFKEVSIEVARRARRAVDSELKQGKCSRQESQLTNSETDSRPETDVEDGNNFNERQYKGTTAMKAIRKGSHQMSKPDCDGPAGRTACGGEVECIHGEELTTTVADERLNNELQKAKGFDQSSQEAKVMSTNHDAETHDDRAGGSHVVCVDHGGRMELDEKE